MDYKYCNVHGHGVPFENNRCVGCINERERLKYFHVSDNDVDCCHDSLSNELSESFIKSGAEFLVVDGEICQVEIIKDIVYIGEQL